MEMAKEDRKDENALAAAAIEGDAQALEALMEGIRDRVFNLSLRMLGTVQDAEDAAQDILVRVMTNLASFRGGSEFGTWVYRIAVNYLLNYKKSMFAHQPLDFEFYGNDIKFAVLDETDAVIEEENREELAEELKMSCTNVMLQCLDPESRCIFILGTMFKIDSRTAGQILDMTPENYRQKLSRIRKRVAAFLAEYCGLGGGMCSCRRRTAYAVKQHRINPKKLEYVRMHPLDKDVLSACKEEMEKLDELSLVFEELPAYQTPETIRDRMEMVLKSVQMKKIQGF